MKRTLTLVMLGMVSAALIGCEAHGKVGDPDNTGSMDSGTHTSVHERTTMTPTHEKTTKTETRTNY